MEKIPVDPNILEEVCSICQYVLYPCSQDSLCMSTEALTTNLKPTPCAEAVWARETAILSD